MAENNGNNTQDDAILDAILNNTPLPTEEQPANPESGSAAPEEKPAAANPEAAAPEKAENPEAAAANSTDWFSEVNKTIGTEFKTPEELKEIVTKGKGYSDLENQLATANQELATAKALQEVSPFANDQIKKLNELTMGGATPEQIDLFNKIQPIDVKALSPEEAKKLALQFDHKLSASEAETMIKSSYKLDESIHDKEIVDAEKIRLKVDAQKDFKYLEDLQVKAAENPANAQKQQTENLVKEYTAKVAPIAKSIQDSLTAIKGVNLNGKEGAEAITIDLPISDESRSKISDLVTQYAVANNIQLNDQGLAHLNEFAQNVALISNWDNMAKHIASKTEERIRTEFHNPSNINRGDDNPADDATVREKQIYDFIVNN